MRRASLEKVFGGGAADVLPARGELGKRAKDAIASGAIAVMTPFSIGRLARTEGGRIRVTGEHEGRDHSVEIDRIIVATGFRPDLDMLREVRLELDPWLESTRALGPLIDPNLHSCGTVRPHGARELAHPEKDFYIVGMKSYGRAPTFLLATGYEQARSVVAELVGDHEAAARVELDLPETGVCSLPGGGDAEGEGCCEVRPRARASETKGDAGCGCGDQVESPADQPVAVVADDKATCCGGPPKENEAACCALDETTKAEGGAGCGCGTKTIVTAQPPIAKESACCA